MKPDTYRRLGELLVQNAVISERQLQIALAEQRSNKRRLGDILVERGYADEQGIAKCLADQYSHPLVNLDSTSVDPTVVTALDAEHAVTLRALPFARAGEGFAVAIADPLDVAATDQLYFLLRSRIEFHVAPAQALKRHIRFAYGLSDEAPGMVAPEASKAPQRFARIQLRLKFEDGSLFDAYDALLDRPVSLFCRKTSAVSAELKEMIRAASSACDPGVVGIHDLDEKDDFTWVVMEPLPVDNLGRVLKVRGPRPLHEAASLVATVSESVDAMGRRARNHGWACPENIFLSDRGPILAPLVAPPAAFRLEDGGSAVNSRGAVHVLGALLEACLLRPYSSDEENLPFQMHEILFRALGVDQDDLFEAPIELSEALRSYDWNAISKPGATTTMEEREQLLTAMEGTLESNRKMTFWDWLFGRSAA